MKRHLFQLYQLLLLCLTAISPSAFSAEPSELLMQGGTFHGVVSDSKSHWPFNVKFLNYDEQSGSFEGEISWPGLRSTAKLEGKVSNDTIEFTTTKAIRRGRVLLGCTYRFNLVQGKWFKGDWDAPETHKGMFSQRAVMIHLDNLDTQLRIGSLSLNSENKGLPSLDFSAVSSNYVQSDIISSVSHSGDQYYVYLDKLGNIGKVPQEYYNNFKQLHESFVYFNSQNYRDTESWKTFRDELTQLVKPTIAYKVPCVNMYHEICKSLQIDNPNIIFESGDVWLLGSGVILKATASYRNQAPEAITKDSIVKVISGRNSFIEEKMMSDRGLIVGSMLTTEAHYLGIRVQNQKIELELAHRRFKEEHNSNLPEILTVDDWGFVDHQITPYLSIWDSQLPKASESELLSKTSQTGSNDGF